MTHSSSRLLRFLRDMPFLRTRGPAVPHKTGSIATSGAWTIPSRRTVLKKGFASGAFAWCAPVRKKEAAAAGIVSCAGDGAEGNRIARMAIEGWRRYTHTERRCERCNGSLDKGKHVGSTVPGKPPEKAVDRKESKPVVRDGEGKEEEGEKNKKAESEQQQEPEQWYVNMKNPIAHLHRPTKDEMLAAATGFFERLRIRTKWSMIRQMRPYTVDEIGAFFSWLLVGQLVWILLGTTTFMSLMLFLVNTVSAQESLARWIGNYLTRETGITVVFESAIIPRWKDGFISFRNVFVSRRPGGPSRVVKGSSATAAAAAQAAVHSEHHGSSSEDDGNYTQFDVTIDTVNVSLSLAKWMNGRGLLQDVEIKGVRGVVDRTHVRWDPDMDPKSYKHKHQPGDFEIDSFKITDLLVTIYQPDGFRPFEVSIFSADLPQLRKQWLFYDFLSANNMSGTYDNSLFTIHPRQFESHANDPSSSHSESPWKKTSRLRIDGLNIDHLNTGIEGPFSWITSATVDILCDASFPSDSPLPFTHLVSEIVQRVEHTVTTATTDPAAAPPATSPYSKKHVHLAMRVNLNNVRAAVPLFPKELSYVNTALIRPIVAYLNSRRGNAVRIAFEVRKAAEEFDGSWTIYDCGLMDDLSAETYEAFSKSVADQQARRRRMKAVGLWSLQVFVQVLALAMAGNLA